MKQPKTLETQNYTHRPEQIAAYILETGDTVRGAAKIFKISKSTVYSDVTEKLSRINYAMYLRVREILDFNRDERHLRGGYATRAKYDKERGTPKTAKRRKAKRRTPK